MSNTIYEEARVVYADGPTSSPSQPPKSAIRHLNKTIADTIESASIGRVDQVTWSGLAAIAGAAAGQSARVLGPDAGTHTDPVVGGTVANIGEYIWSVSPAGWRRTGNIVREIVYAGNTHSGNANAITAASDGAFDPTPGKALITVNFVATNTGAMTISIDGETARPLVLNVGSPIPAGYVSAGMSALVQIDSAGNYRLFSYGDASAIQAAVEAVLALFNTQYLGAYVSNPATDPAGGTLQQGAFYWNTTSKAHFYWDGDSWEAFPFATVIDGAVTEQKLNDDLASLITYNAPGLTDLKALSSARTKSAFLMEPGRAGHFIVLTGDYSAAVAADVGEGVFAKANDAAATDKVWARADTTFLHPLMFGAEGQSDCTQAFLDCLAAADYLGKPMHILERALSYPIQGGTNFAAVGRNIIGVGMPVIKMLGSGRGFSMDGSMGVDAYKTSMHVSNLIIEGNPAVTDGFYCYGAVQGSRFQNIRVRECSNKAFNIINGVAALYDGLTCSANVDRTMTTIPLYGLYLDGDGAGNYTADCTFRMLIMESLADTGISVSKANGNMFQGGTSEGNSTGVDFGTGAIRNKFTNLWCELNTTGDISVRGTMNGFDSCTFISASSGNTVEIPNGQATRFRDCYVRVANLQSPSANTIFDGCEFSDNAALGITGPGSYRTFGCVKTNTSGEITEVMADV